ncbi:hypothetical protein FNH05_22255 [Amycolatopsis rhizosphaerae]|uniref:ESX-1 secretion-associated protein n=1 Tax=Amycolatopsis rhizosphaerae TaxID=2053003 RepID=A0A558C152_9PSEU|nr:hypothetical protein [Amycolatopsis rhizosphaerae]TVT42520.1 hypothetical protein FNH05_22255 [Amycolatopsis rhizosphaerae]
MGGYEIIIDKIAAAGQAAQRVADVIAPLDFAGAIPDGDAGMPGARAVAKLAAVKQDWAGKVKPTATGFTDYARDMANAANYYRNHEDAAQRDLRQFQMPKGMS